MLHIEKEGRAEEEKTMTAYRLNGVLAVVTLILLRLLYRPCWARYLVPETRSNETGLLSQVFLIYFALVAMLPHFPPRDPIFVQQHSFRGKTGIASSSSLFSRKLHVSP